MKYDKERQVNIEKVLKRKVKPEYQKVYEVIGLRPIRIEEICRKSCLEVREVNSILLMLEIEGYIKKNADGYVCNVSK